MNFELISPLFRSLSLLPRLKRKVQNFLPCKTPTRGGHLDPNGLPRSGQLAATYEDPDAHMGHSPLVLGHPQFQHRNHHNLEVSVVTLGPRRRPTNLVPLYFSPLPCTSSLLNPNHSDPGFPVSNCQASTHVPPFLGGHNFRTLFTNRPFFVAGTGD